MATKRKSHFFEIYITKILKNICIKAELACGTRIQLNILLQILSQKIVDIVYILLSDRTKNTITISNVQNAIDIFLSGELKKNARDIATKVLDQKYTLIIPNYLVEKYLRKFGTSKYKVSRQSITYLSAVLEYLLGEMLDLAFTYTKYQKRLRITVSDLEQSLQEDDEFQLVLLKYNIVFLNGNKIKNIPKQITQTRKKVRKNGKLRYLQGGKILKTIKKLQQQNNNILPIGSFRKMIHEIFKHKISESFVNNFQYFIESFLEDILTKSQQISLHSKRNKLDQSDIKLLCDLNNINYQVYQEIEPVENDQIINVYLDLENNELSENVQQYINITDY
jgi:histone H3/H4